MFAAADPTHDALRQRRIRSLGGTRVTVWICHMQKPALLKRHAAPKIKSKLLISPWQLTHLGSFTRQTFLDMLLREEREKMWMRILIRTALSFLEGFAFAHIHLGSCQSSPDQLTNVLTSGGKVIAEYQAGHIRRLRRPCSTSGNSAGVKMSWNIKQSGIWRGVTPGLEEVEADISLWGEGGRIPLRWYACTFVNISVKSGSYNLVFLCNVFFFFHSTG